MSRDSEGLSLKFALKMVQMADRPDLIWLRHEVEPYPDDNPVNSDGTPGNFRHLSIHVERPHFFDIEAECFVYKTAQGWSQGSVRIGHYGENGTVYTHDPEQFYQYNREHGMFRTRRVPIEVSKTENGYKARVLDNPDSTPSLRGWEDHRLPSAIGSTENEAIGALVAAKPALFRVVVRHSPDFAEEEPEPLKIVVRPSQESLKGMEGKKVRIVLNFGSETVEGIVKHLGEFSVITETILDGIPAATTTMLSNIKQIAFLS